MTTKYRLIDNISLTEVDDELVLLNLETGSYYGLNHIGTELVNAIKCNIPIKQIILNLSEQYQIEADVVSTDIQQLIDQLLDQKLLAVE